MALTREYKTRMSRRWENNKISPVIGVFIFVLFIYFIAVASDFFKIDFTLIFIICLSIVMLGIAFWFFRKAVIQFRKDNKRN